MRLVIATGIYPPDIGGPATYSKQLAEALSKENWKVAVLTYAGNTNGHENGEDMNQHENGGDPNGREQERKNTQMGERKTDTGFTVIEVSRKHNVLVRYFLYTWQLVKLARKSDLIYAQGPVSEGFPAYFACKITGKKYALKVVGDCAWERWQNCDANMRVHANDKNKNGDAFVGLDQFQGMSELPLKTKILRYVQKLVAGHASVVITPSQYLKTIVKQWGVPEDKVRVVYNAIVSQKSNVESRKSKQYRGSEDIILSVGRLVPWKGFDTLIDIMPDLWKINPNFKLMIVGEGPEYGRLSQKSKACPELAEWVKSQKSGEEKIFLIGKLEHEELMQYMHQAKMFVLNSGYEGLSHVIIEAMESGLPVAASNIGGNPELVENKKTGLLFAYNDKEQIKKDILHLWQDEELGAKLAENAKNKVGEFRFEKMLDDTRETLLDIKKSGD